MNWKLLIKNTENDGRWGLIPELLKTKWTIEVVDFQRIPDLEKKLPTADAIISQNWNNKIPTSKRLKLIHCPGAGTDEIDFSSVPKQTKVCNVFEHDIGIAEYVLSGMLKWTVDLPKLDAALRQGKWDGSYMFGPRHRELNGSTLGIIGYGRIGQATAFRARAFGMKIISCSRNIPSNLTVQDEVRGMDSLHWLLKQADFILISAPLNHATRDLIGEIELGLMKKNCVLINVSRGEIVNEEALYRACKNKIIAGAIIDTWYKYPTHSSRVAMPSKFPFHQLDNITMTPHASAWTEELFPRRNRVIAQNLDLIQQNQKLKNVVWPT